MHAVEPSKTRRLYLLLKAGIESGSLSPGHRLPSETELAATHKLSRVTVRRALDGLEQGGLIQRRPGAGTFVVGAERPQAIVGDLANTLAHLVEMGRSTRVRLIQFGYDMPPAAIAAALGLHPGDRTQRSVRVRYLEDQPFSYLVTHVPERIGVTYSEQDLSTTPLLVLLEHSGVVAARARQVISATFAGPDVSGDLDIEIGAPLISLVRTVFDRDGQGVEHLTALYRPDRYHFEMDLTRIGSREDRRWSSAVKQDPTTARRPRAAQWRRRP